MIQIIIEIKHKIVLLSRSNHHINLDQTSHDFCDDNEKSSQKSCDVQSVKSSPISFPKSAEALGFEMHPSRSISRFMGEK